MEGVIKFVKKVIVVESILLFLLIGGAVYLAICFNSYVFIAAGVLFVIWLMLFLLRLSYIPRIKKNPSALADSIAQSQFQEFLPVDNLISNKLVDAIQQNNKEIDERNNMVNLDLFRLLKKESELDEAYRKNKITQDEYKEELAYIEKCVGIRKKHIESLKSVANSNYLGGKINKVELELELKKYQDELDGYERLKNC